MTSIIVGVDASERSEDAIAFGRRIAGAGEADVIVACAFAYSDAAASSSTYRYQLRDEALATAQEMRDRLTGLPADRSAIRVMTQPSAAHGLHDLAQAEHAALLVVGSTHTGRAGRVLPGSTGERLLHGSPCAVAIVPDGYRTQPDTPIRRIGVAYNGSDEARAALSAAAELARALGAELEVIGVVGPETYIAPALVGVSDEAPVDDIKRHFQDSLDAIVAELPDGVSARAVCLTGGAAERLAAHSSSLDLLVTGSRGYGPLHSVLVGGVSGRLARMAQCPVIVVPRGVEAPLGTLFGDAQAVAV